MSNKENDQIPEVDPQEEILEEVTGEVVEEIVPEKKDKDKKKSKSQEKKGPSAEEQLQAEREKYLRLAAEYDNYRKRSAKERENIFADVRSDTIAKFLPVYDNLVRALEQTTEDEAYRKGVELIMSQFEETLERLGVTPIEALGQKFDPALHNAVMHVDDETLGENEVVMEFQRGFKIGDKIIRFSTVQVAN